MKRPLVILLFGGLLCVSCYPLLPLALEKLLLPAETTEEEAQRIYICPSEHSSGMAPVLLWTDMWRGARSTEQGQKKDYWKAIKAEKLFVIHGFAFADDKMLPTKTIKSYLDQKVLTNEISFVAVFAANNTQWGDLFPIIDECRKSRVKTVLLNFELPTVAP